MYKISEEDSQDEEVLNSLASRVSVSVTLGAEGNTNNNGGPFLRVKPVPPVKPAFLRKSNNAGSSFSGPLPKLSVNVNPIKETNDEELEDAVCDLSPPFVGHQNRAVELEDVNWSSGSSSGGSEESGEVTTEDDHGAYMTNRNKRKTRENWDESTDSSCSSCDDNQLSQRRHSERHNDQSDDNGSYYSSTDHQEESDVDFDSGSEYFLEEEVAALITEGEIQSLAKEDGSMLLCDYVSVSNSPEILNSTNEKSSLSSKSKSIRTSHNLSRAAGDLEMDLASTSKSHQKSKGKISRILRRKDRSKGSDSKLTTTALNQTDLSGDVEKFSTVRPKQGFNKVFRFKDEHEGEIRGVELVITKYSKHNLGRRATMVESLLGIVPSRFSSPSQISATDRLNSSRPNTTSSAEDKRIMVAGFITGGPSAKNKHIKIGDWLQKVNGVMVDFSNVNSVLLQTVQQESKDDLETVPLKISLELQRVSGYTVTDAPTTTKSVKFEEPEGESAAASFVIPKGMQQQHQEFPPEIMSKIVVIYISIVNASSTFPVSKEKTKDVIFAWPKESESRKVSALSASHGMFSTLYKLLNDVCGSHPISSRVMIDEEEMDVVFSSDDQGKGLLLIATATTLSNFNISHPSESTKKEKKLRWKDPVNGSLVLAHRLMSRIQSLLKFQFGSFSRAFRGTGEEKLNQFFSEALYGLCDISEEFLFPQVPSHFLRVPPRIRCSIDEALYSFESSDSFSLCHRRLEDVPLFNCIGSCLYYKGMLVFSHLERQIASDFHGWWKTQLGLWAGKRKMLPYVWEPLKRLILWQATYSSQNDVTEQVPENISQNCYSVMVGVGNYMLGMVLEPVNPQPSLLNADIGWIQRGFNCVLKIMKSEIHTCLEKWIHGQAHEFIELFPASRAGNTPFPSGSSNSKTLSFATSSSISSGPSGILKNADPSQPLPSSSASSEIIRSNEGSGKTSDSSVLVSDNRVSAHDYTYHHGLSHHSERLEFGYGSNNEEDEGEESNTIGTGSDTSSLKRYLDESRMVEELSCSDELQTISITKGNVLFDFLQIEHGRNVLLRSKDREEGPFAVVIHNFRQSATLCHNILHKAANARTRLSRQMSDKKWIGRALAPISEHGILFNCDVVDPRDAHKKKPRLRQISYWVVGRIYPNQREIYLCYQDSSVSQNLIEIAFKLAYYSI